MRPEQIVKVQQGSIRWMGMGVGVFIFAVGGFIVATGALLAVAIVGSKMGFGAAPEKPMPTELWGLTVGFIAVGLPILLYGKSVFRRARTDAVIVSTPTLPAGPGAADHRGLAWVAVVFSSLMVLASAGLVVTSQGGSSFGGFVFLPVLIGAVRYLRQKR